MQSGLRVGVELLRSTGHTEQSLGMSWFVLICPCIISVSPSWADQPNEALPMRQTAARPQLLTVAQAASLLNVSEKTIRRWVTDGKVPYVKLPSGGVRIRRARCSRRLRARTTSRPRSPRSMHGLRTSPKTTCAPPSSSGRLRAGLSRRAPAPRPRRTNRVDATCPPRSNPASESVYAPRFRSKFRIAAKVIRLCKTVRVVFKNNSNGGVAWRHPM